LGIAREQSGTIGEERTLVSGVGCRFGWVRAQVVADEELVAPEGTVDFRDGQVEVGRATSAEIDPAGDEDFAETLVAECLQHRKVPGSRRQVGNADEEVDDRLARHARNRSASEVFDPCRNLPEGAPDAVAFREE
jgi:hypothetical protein